METSLIIVDVQNDYFTDGLMELVGMEKAASNCKQLLDYFRSRQKPVFHIQHIIPGENAPFFVKNTAGSEIHNSVKPQDSEPVLLKHFPSAFRETKLNKMLQESGIDDLVICGAMSHMCIDTTVRAAFDLGYRCQVVSDACATCDLEFNGQVVKAVEVHAAFMAALSSPFAEVLSTNQLMGE